MSSPLGFNAGGIDAVAIVSSLMDAERLPIDAIRRKQAAVKLQSDAVGRVKTSLETIRSASSEIVNRGLARTSVTSSSTAVQATALTGAVPGTVSFSVSKLASAQGLRTSSPVSATTAQVTSLSRLALSTSASKTGISALSASSDVAAGAYSVAVTQASTAASLSGSNLSSSVTVNNGSQNLTLEVSGVARNLTLATGNYTSTALAAEIQSKLDAAGGGAIVSVNASGALTFTSTNEGSAMSLAVTGGNARSNLGLLGLSTPVSGTDAKVTVNGGAETTLTATGPGQSAALAAGGGTLSVSFTSGARVGSTSVSVVSTGDGSLSSVAAAVNASTAGVSAAAVKQGDGAWLLQLASKSTGAASVMTVDAAAFTSVGGLVQTASGEDAQLTVGSGAGAYTVSSSTNVFTDLIAGVSVTAKETTASAVSVSVARDESASSALVERLVNAVNSLIADVKMQTRFDPVSRVSSPLSNDARIKALPGRVRAAVSEVVADAGLTMSDIGVTLLKDGSLSFDKSKFETALKSSSTAVERIFARGGSSSGGVSWVAALDSTKSGSYVVNVSTVATRASTGTMFSTPPSTTTVVGVKSGSSTATASLQAGASQSEMIAAMNLSLSTAGVAATAVASGSGFVVRANSYGLGGSFEVNTDVAGAGVYTPYSAVDASGTIDGVAATASGARLSLSGSASSSAKGLAVDTSAMSTPASVSISYAPGAAARLSALVSELNETAGALTIASGSYDARVKGFTTQIDRLEDRLTERQKVLTKKWGKVQSSLSSLQSQQEWLTNQTKSMSGSSS